MAHGYPDWGQTAGTKTVYQLTDMAELAARLGSIVTFDRRGDVIWLDDFENTLNKWLASSAGSGASVALSVAQARNGAASALLTGGSDGTRLAQIRHLQPFPVLSKMGFEFSFCRPGTFESINLEADMWDGVNHSQFYIRYDPVNDLLRYIDSNDAFVTFASGLNYGGYSTLFNTMKLVFDPDADEYVRFIFNNKGYSLADIAAWVEASAANPALDLRVILYSRSGQNDQAYVDDVIITQNEP